ncbi:hypothetical protein, partial [Nitratireductor aquimarinus]|uniref:hypothetical protein n=1 Tax=Nitratireductor aquimarinus TaxID=889300 RepID=UPI001A8DEBF6
MRVGGFSGPALREAVTVAIHLEGIAKLFDVDCKSGDFSQSGRHLGGITVPQAEGIGSGMTV